MGKRTVVSARVHDALLEAGAQLPSLSCSDQFKGLERGRAIGLDLVLDATLRVLGKSSDTGWLTVKASILKTSKGTNMDTRRHSAGTEGDGCTCPYTSTLVATYPVSLGLLL